MRRLLACLLTAACCAAPCARAAAPRVLGGHRVEAAAWPFVVALVDAGRADAFQGQFCGGSLVAPRVVVTAAHCVDGRPLDVVAGRTVLSAAGGERIRVAATRRPPGYDPAADTPDLAVLVLARPAAEAPVAVAGPADAALVAPGRALEVAGWGLVAQAPRELSPDTLRAATLRALPPSACLDAYGGGQFVPGAMLCAGTPGTGIPDSCRGDSGGPLVARGPAGTPRLVAVVSYGGSRCGDPAEPGVYARIAPRAGWLAREIAVAAAAPEPPAAAPAAGAAGGSGAEPPSAPPAGAATASAAAQPRRPAGAAHGPARHRSPRPRYAP